MYSKALVAVLLLSQAAAPALCAAADDESAIEPAQAARCVVIWAPAGRLRADSIADILDGAPLFRLTLAVSPDDVDEPDRLAAWAAEGRIELALRIPGDPILPLVEARRSQDAVSRVVLARQRHLKVFGRPPRGLVPGAGAFSERLILPAGAQGLRWASAGDYAQGAAPGAWIRRGDFVLVPTKVIDEEELDPLEARDSAVFLMDPKSRSVPPALTACASTASELADYAARPPEEGSLPPEAAASTGAAPGAEPPWPAWAGPISELGTEPEAQQAWDLYGQAAEALTQYQNSGRASLGVLDKAVSALYAAQDSRFFQNAPSDADRRDFQARLRKVYKVLGSASPAGLRAKASSGAAGADASAEQAADSDHIRSGRAGESLFFELVPAASTAPLDSPLTGLRVGWDPGAVIFTFESQASSASPSGSGGKEQVLRDLYIDINHRAGAGSVDLLPGRAAFLSAADAWEYALAIAGSAAVLYRYAPGQGPALVERLRAESDPEAMAVRVRVPRSRLRGNPAVWGYLALALPADPASAQKFPPLPSRNEILGALAVLTASADPSKQEPSGAGPRYRRFSALRLEKGAVNGVRSGH